MRRYLALVGIMIVITSILIYRDAHRGPHVAPELAWASWEYDVICSGLDSQQRGGLSNVVFVTIDSFPIDPHTGIGSLAEWHPAHGSIGRDTIEVLRDYVDSSWVIRHELMHQLIHDTNPGINQHPYYPFTFPCRLQVFQHWQRR